MRLRMICCLLGIFSSVLSMTVPIAHATDVLYGAKEQSGHYYKIFEFKMTWNDAETFCESVGGHLATIESDDESGVIRAVLQDGVNWWYWIGGVKEDGVWKWNNGKPMTYTNWDSNNSRDVSEYNRLYLERRTAKWNGLNSDKRNSFICEWESKENAHDSNW